VFELDRDGIRRTDPTNRQGRIVWQFPFSCNSSISVREKNPAAGYALKTVLANFHYGDFCRLELSDKVGVDSVRWLADGTCRIHVSNMPRYNPPHNADSIENSVMRQRPDVSNAVLCPCGSGCGCEGNYPPDFRTEARSGYLQCCKDKLSRIVVYYGDSLVRAYSFCYGSDIFGRAQLRRILEWGADCSAEPSVHELDYYEEGDAASLLDVNAATITGTEAPQGSGLEMAAHKLSAPLEAVYASLGGATLLSGQRSVGFGVSGGADVGFGNPESKESSVALSAGCSPRYGRGLGTLIDIDGDGLPDHVIRHGGNLYYQPQTAGGFGTKQRLSGFSDFLRDQSSSFNCGLSANIYAHGGVNWNRTSSKTTVYFCDINGDGLLDLVHDNACDGVTPSHFPPTFVSDGCGVRVEQDGEAVVPCISMDGVPGPEDDEEDGVSWPFYDMVRVWSNEDMNDIRLTGILAEACLDPTPIADAVETDDTLFLSVEFYGRTLNVNYPATYHFVIAETMIRPGECVWNGDLLSVSTLEIPIDQLDLASGCLVFFRARSLHGRPVSHLLHWDPVVHTNASYPAGVNTHGNQASYSDFPRASDSIFICPATGMLHIEVRDINSQYHFVYVKKSKQKKLNDTSFSVNEGDTLMFMAVGNTPTQWQNLQWHPYVYYSNVNTGGNASTGMTVTGGNGTTIPTFGFYPTPYYRCYRASNGVFPKSLPHPVFGTMYGGWGAFQYRHSDAPIMDTVKLFSKSGLPSDFHFDIHSYDLMEDTTRTCNFADSTAFVLDSLTRCLDVIPLTPDNGDILNRGLFPNAYVYDGDICLGYMTEEPMDGGVSQQGCGVLQSASRGGAMTQKACSKSGNVRMLSYGSMDKVSVSDGFSITYTKPFSTNCSNTRGIRSRSRMTQDLMDMNGDGVPDFIRNGRVYYSLPDLGGWDNSPKELFMEWHHLAKSESRSENHTARVSLPFKKSSASGKGSSVICCSFGTGTSKASDTVLHTLADINGDGLPDLLYSNEHVRLNTGYGFAGDRRWEGLSVVGSNCSSSRSISGSDISVWKDAISGGINFTNSENKFVVVLQDINGDGLPDLVRRGGDDSIVYRPNTGNSFSTSWICWKDPHVISQSEWDNTSSADLSANYTAGGLFLGMKWGGSIGAEGSVSVSNSCMQITDFNGDGLPDLLATGSTNTLQVFYAHLGRTGLLKRVTNPLGGSITMDYGMTAANVYHSRRWVMTKVVVHDSLPGDGCDSLRTSIRYDHGYYDRTEREFLGFAVVVEEPLDGNGNAMRSVIRYYDNGSVHTKGGLRCEAVVRIREVNGLPDTLKYLLTTCSYDTVHIVVPVAGSPDPLFSVFPKLTRRQTCFFEGLQQARITAWEEFDYENAHGNVVRQRQGSTDQTTVEANISYHAQYNGNHCVNRVSSVEIPGFRKRTTEVDNKGHYTVFRDWYSSTQNLATRLQYDDFGNITTMRGPNTTVHYTYDDYVHGYPTAITDTFGVSSYLQNYDFRFGIPRTVVDQAGNRMYYTLDDRGRTLTIQGPKEYVAQVPYTIRYIYSGREPAPSGSTHQRAVSMAMTEHYDPQHPNNSIKTYTYCDGLGRIVQTRKEAAVNGVEKLVISGHTVVDALGRTVETYYPTEIHKDSTRFRFITDQSAPASTVTYDILDRPLVQTAPDASTTTFQYGFDNSHQNKMLFSTTTTDANSHPSIELKDVSGKPWVIHPSGQQPVCFNYNLVGDNTKVYSSVADDWERNYTYDWLGRRLTYVEGELAESYTYNGGQISSHSQSWLENGITQNKTTQYHYNAHRLDSMSYEDALTTIYHYDQYGRVDSLYDESGVMCYEYGNMGEVTRETRIYALPFLTNALALSTQFTYDSWGRVLNITYPDNEVVGYTYDLGGQLRRVYSSQLIVNSYLDSV
jgi:YD repeat-containing protein